MAESAQSDFLGALFDRFGISRKYLAHLRELRSRLLRVLFTVGFFYVLFFMFEFKQVAELWGVPVFAPVFNPFHPFAAQLVTQIRIDLIPADVQVFQISATEIVVLYME